MIDLIEKRYPEPGWIVVDEVGNGTGSNVTRHADAVAFGIWPSHGYAIHGFECKVSRSDLLREFSDPSKADAVGRYCDYWWLVVGDLKIIDGVEIPETWGVLYPKAQVLRVHKKAPRREADPINRRFQAATIRKVMESYVPKWKHDEFRKTATETIRVELAKERQYTTNNAEHELKQLRDTVKRFEEFSGVEITSAFRHRDGVDSMPKSAWEIERIGKAVEVVIKARDAAGHRFSSDVDPLEFIDAEIRTTRNGLSAGEQSIARRKAALAQLEELRATTAHEFGVTTPAPADALELP